MKTISAYMSLTVCAISVFLVVHATALYAATGKKSNLVDIIKASDLIVEGVFTGVDTNWRNNKIFTTGVFKIKSTLKGFDMASVLVEYPGGTAMHSLLKTPVTVKVTNEAEFKTGEELVLILKKISDNKYRIITPRGKLVISLNKKKQEKIVSGVKKIHGESGDGTNHVVMSSEPMSIDEFTQYVSGLLDQVK